MGGKGFALDEEIGKMRTDNRWRSREINSMRILNAAQVLKVIILEGFGDCYMYRVLLNYCRSGLHAGA